MRIIHYTLGFPPFRTGGLTKYAIDCAKTQMEEDNNVTVLWPGKIKRSGKQDLKSSNYNGIDSVEIINPLPVPLLEGIRDFDSYTKSQDISEFEKYILKEKPDIIYIHTLMGLYSEMVDFLAKEKITTVYITHDFFGICPKVILFDENKEEICKGNDFSKCYNCNRNALSIKAIRFLQSPLYRKIKNSKLLRMLKFRRRKKISIQGKTEDGRIFEKQYKLLQEYYVGMLNKFTYIHCNSSISYGVYKDFINDPKKLFIKNISHRDINDHRVEKSFNKEKICFLFIGSSSKYKGFPLLIDVLDEVYKVNTNFTLCSYGAYTSYERTYLEKHERYSYNELPTIFGEKDVFLFPSVCQETYGFTVLEALSYGVPVIVSSTSGVKDLVQDGNGFVFESKEQLKAIILDIISDEKREKLININRNIVKSKQIQTLMNNHTKK